MSLIGIAMNVYSQQSNGSFLSIGETNGISFGGTTRLKIENTCFESSYLYIKSESLSQTIIRNGLKSDFMIYGLWFKASVDYHRNLSIADNRKMPVIFSLNLDRSKLNKLQPGGNLLPNPKAYEKVNLNYKDTINSPVNSNLDTIKSLKNISLRGNLIGSDSKSLNRSELPSGIPKQADLTTNFDTIYKKQNDSANNATISEKSDQLDSSVRVMYPASSKVFNSVKKFDFGKSVLNYSDLTFQDFLLTGIHGQLLFKNFFAGIAAGQNAEWTNSNLRSGLNFSRQKYQILMVRGGMGDMHESHTHITFLWIENKGKMDPLADNISYSSAKLINLESVWYSTDNTKIGGEISKIIRSMPGAESTVSAAWDQELAWKAFLSKDFKKAKSTININYLETGSYFQNPGNSFMLPNQRSLNGKFVKGIIKNVVLSAEITWSDFNKDRTFDFDIQEVKYSFNALWNITRSVIMQGSYLRCSLRQEGKNSTSGIVSRSSFFDLNLLYLGEIRDMKLNSLFDFGIWENWFTSLDGPFYKSNSYQMIVHEHLETGSGHTLSIYADLNMTELMKWSEPYSSTALFMDKITVLKYLTLEPGIGIRILNNSKPIEKASLNALLNYKRLCWKNSITCDSGMITGKFRTTSLWINSMIRIKI